MVGDNRHWRKVVTDAGFGYLRCGLSVIPIKADCSKAPDLPEWTTFQNERPHEGHIAAWYGGAQKGIAIIAGAVSGNLEVMDFDLETAWTQWREAVLETPSTDVSWQRQKFPLVETPSGGRHLFYRLPGTPPTNTKLARWMVAGKPKTVIETRGEHGYVLAPGSPTACHPTYRQYRLLQGDFAAIPVISMEVRDLFHSVARSLNTVEAIGHLYDPRPQVATGDRPGDIYNARADWVSLLRRHGWQLLRHKGDEIFWRRPGKQRGGVSATSNWNNTNLFYCFSSNADPFEQDRGYTKFAAYGLLEHNGDWQAAARDLAAKGYCSTEQQHRPAVVPASAPLLQRMEMRLSTGAGRW